MKGKFSLMWRVAITLVMVLTLGLVMAAPVAATVGTPTVTVDPTTISQAAEYTIVFTTTVDLSSTTSDDIRVEFPSDTTVPAASSIEGNVTINGNTVGTGKVTVVSRLVTLKVPVDVPLGTVTVVFAVAAGIVNPSTAATTYTMDVSTSREVTPVTSAQYSIIPPPPTVTGVSPATGVQGASLTVVITGTYFTGATAASFGAGITASITTIDSDTQITAGLVIDSDATLGYRDVSVTTPSGTGTLTDGFTVVAPPPTVTSVAPPEANQGETLDVVITGTNLSGATTVDFDSLISVTFTVDSATEITASITIDSTAITGLRDVSVTTAAGTGTGTNVFTVGVAETALVDRYNAAGVYQDSFSTIGAAITAATGGDTLIAHAGTYTEDLDILAGKDNLELVGAEGAVIKGVATYPGPFPDGRHNIKILASGVEIHGFTIESPDAVVGSYSMGMYIGASDVEIYDNAFKTHTQDTGQYSVVIQTWRYVVLAGVDISGLDIHDNTFDDLGDGTVGYDGIYVNIDTGALPIAIEDNVFTGSLFRAITVERSNAVISGNTIITDLAPYIRPPTGLQGGYQGMFIGCFEAEGGYPAQSDVSITGNTVKGATTSDGFEQGIRVGHTYQEDLSNMVVSRNTVQDCDEGITVRGDASGVTVSYNDITGNIVGVQNDDTEDELDARYNWWGKIGGSGGAGLGNGDNVSTNVAYNPWLTKLSEEVVDEGICYFGSDTLALQAGWNTLSVPLALYDSADTIGEIRDLGDFLTVENFEIAYQYDPTGNCWEPIVVSPITLVPCRGYYIKMVEESKFPVLYSNQLGLPALALDAGWNLIGSAFGIAIGATVASPDPDNDGNPADAETGAKRLVGGALDSIGDQASVVVSPSVPGQLEIWSSVYPCTGKELFTGEAYWVFMKDSGTLAGFEITPLYLRD